VSVGHRGRRWRGRRELLGPGLRLRPFESCPPCCEVTVNISEARRRIGALRATLRVSYTWIRQIIHQPYYARPTSTPTPSTVSTHVLVHRSAIDPPCDRIGRCSSRAPSGRVLLGLVRTPSERGSPRRDGGTDGLRTCQCVSQAAVPPRAQSASSAGTPEKK